MPTDSPELESIKVAAAVWIAAHERGLTAEEQDRYFEWLAADPRHSEVLAHQRAVMQSLKKLVHWRPEHAARPNPDLLALWPTLSQSNGATPRRHRKFLRFVLPLALATAAAIAVVIWQRDVSPAVDASVPAIVRKVLEDGSTIDLKRGAEVEVAYSATRRDVRLLKGEATFKVAKNPDRPFVVATGDVTFRAVGTTFNVHLQASTVELMVTEGKVQVDRLGASAEAGRAPSLPLVGEGYRTVVNLVETGMPAVEPVTAAELARVLARQPSQLEFSDTPLAQVAVEFNAENRLKIVIDDPVLAAMPIGASLRSDNVEGFVRVLETNFGVEAQRRGDMIVLKRKL